MCIRDSDINWGSSEGDNLKRFDFGLAFGAGVEIKSFRLGISYELGLTNLSVTQIDGSKISNRVLGISFGYKILGK